MDGRFFRLSLFPKTNLKTERKPMPNSERTFADRLARGRSMHAIVAGFVPGFTPSDISLVPATYETFLDSIEALNTAVNAADSAVSPAVSLHKTLLLTIKQRTTQVVANVKSVAAWKQYLPAVKQAADKVRGYNPKQKPRPAPAPRRSPGAQAAQARPAKLRRHRLPL